MSAYKPGQIVERSGIYKVVHDTTHPRVHEVTCIKGKRFPPCVRCEHPTFELVHEAIHIDEDEYFKK